VCLTIFSEVSSSSYRTFRKLWDTYSTVLQFVFHGNHFSCQLALLSNGGTSHSQLGGYEEVEEEAPGVQTHDDLRLGGALPDVVHQQIPQVNTGLGIGEGTKNIADVLHGNRGFYTLTT